MVARLGGAIHILSILIGVFVTIRLYFEHASRFTGNVPIDIMAECALVGLVIWLMGLLARYVLAGK